MIYRAAAALPDDDRERATAGLCGQLRLMALAGGTTPDWTTLAVDGPTRTTAAQGGELFEWSATVRADGDDLPADVGGAGSAARAMTETQPG